MTIATITIPRYHIDAELFRAPRMRSYRALRDSDHTRVIIKTLNNNYPANCETTVNAHLGESL